MRDLGGSEDFREPHAAKEQSRDKKAPKQLRALQTALTPAEPASQRISAAQSRNASYPCFRFRPYLPPPAKSNLTAPETKPELEANPEGVEEFILRLDTEKGVVLSGPGFRILGRVYCVAYWTKVQ